MLHLIYQSPLESATLERIAINDSILFMENALFRLLKSNKNASELESMSTQYSLFVLDDEIEIRGIHPNELIAGIKVIDYQTFVTLTINHLLIQTWN
jgi:tRNA 2-thiouridine synthesizing protein B